MTTEPSIGNGRRKNRAARAGELLLVIGAAGAGLAAWLLRDAPRPADTPAARRVAAEWVEVPAAPAGEDGTAPVAVVARYKPLPEMREYKGEPVLWAAEVELGGRLRDPGILAAAGELSFPVPGLEEPLVIPVRRARTDVNGVLGVSGSPGGTAADFFALAVDGDKVAATLAFPVAKLSYAICHDSDTGKQMMLALGEKPRDRGGDGGGGTGCGGFPSLPEAIAETPRVYGKLSRKNADVPAAALSSATTAAANESPASTASGRRADVAGDSPASPAMSTVPPVPPLGGIAVKPIRLAGESATEFAERSAGYQARAEGAPAANRIDVIVGYNESAEAKLTGFTGSLSLTLNLQFQITNWVYAQSGVDAELNLVAAFRTWIPVGMDNLDVIDALFMPGDGLMDEISVLGEAYAADFVCVMSGDDDYSSSYATHRFSVINAAACDVRYMATTHAHEHGHNLGANHARNQITEPGMHEYAVGHYWSHPAGGVYHARKPDGGILEGMYSGDVCTVMTYGGLSIQNDSRSFLDLPYMSNASLGIDFAPPYTNVAHTAKLGQSAAEFPNDARDNARRANEQAPVSAAYSSFPLYQPALAMNAPTRGDVNAGHRYYFFDIPAEGVASVAVTLAGVDTGADSLDMGINTPNRPYWAPTVADAEIFLDGASATETHTFTNPRPGRYFITVHRNTAAAVGFTLALTTPGAVVVAPPVITPGATAFATPLAAKLVSPEGNAIRYTLDGSDPTAAHGVSVKSGATVAIGKSAVLKAVCVKDALASGIVSQGYRIEDYPIITLENGVRRDDRLAGYGATVIYRYVLPVGATTMRMQIGSDGSSYVLYRHIRADHLVHPLDDNEAVHPDYYVASDYPHVYDDPEPGVWYFPAELWTGDAADIHVIASHEEGARNMRDFNGDGKADVVFRNSNSHGAAVWYMNGNSRDGAADFPAADPLWKIQDIGDFDNDGRADILWRHATTHQPAIWFMDGTAKSRAANPANPGPEWRVAAVADFDNDKHADILWQHRTTHQLAIWFMDGATRRSAENVALNPGGIYRVVGAADFDNNGRADILFQHRGTGALAVWTMNGAQRVAGRDLAPVPPADWEAVETADYYGGGDTASILFRNVNTHALVIWRYRDFVRESSAQVATVPTRHWEVGNNRVIRP